MKILSRILRVSLMLIGFTAVAPLAFAASDNGTLTVGATVTCDSPPTITFLSGYWSGVFRSYSPTGLTGGKTVFVVVD